MDQREEAGAGYCEQRHRLGEAVDRGAPVLSEQQEDRGDERAGVANADPPDEVDDGEGPADRDVDSPDAHAAGEEPRDRDEEQLEEPERQRKADEPPDRGLLLEDEAG